MPGTGGSGHIITEVFAFIALHADGDEGVIAVPIGGQQVPLIAVDRERMEALRPTAMAVANMSGMPVRLIRLQERVEEEVIEPQ